jgi:GNAT superfamily N-acetyltransferase
VSRRTLDVTLDELPRLPGECLESCFWELAEDVEGEDARFQKEEWFSTTLLEWGPCGKLTVDGEKAQGFAQFGPASLFPRLEQFRAGRISPDAIYLANCYVVRRARGRGIGTHLVRTVARDLVDRGYFAVEAIGDREWAGGWVLPMTFLGANGFAVVRDDPRFPLMRLDVRTAVEPERETVRAAVSLPSAAPAPGLA